MEKSSTPRRGLSRVQAAEYVGVSASKFDQLVRDRRMPAPKRIDGRRVWDVRALDVSFEALPSEGDDDDSEAVGMMFMFRKPPPFCQGFVDRHGRSRWYFRKRGFNRTPLPGLPWSPEFMAAHASVHGRRQLLPGHRQQAHHKRQRVRVGRELLRVVRTSRL